MELLKRMSPDENNMYFLFDEGHYIPLTKLSFYTRVDVSGEFKMNDAKLGQSI